MTNDCARAGAGRCTLAALTATLACLLPAAADAACDLSRFGASAATACNRSEASCMGEFLPREIKDIGRGAAVEWVGLFVNDGRASWRGLDLDRKEVVVVERYAGPRVGQAPRVAAPTAHEYLKTTGSGDAAMVDHVRRYPLSTKAFESLGCVAAADWTSPAVRERSDMASRAWRLLGDKSEPASALGVFGGKPGEFVSAVDAIVKRQKPGAAAR